MRIFWLFRSNLRHLEYYHEYKTLEEFEEKCHDFYMLFPIWLLRNNYFDEVVVWRLTKKPRSNIDFDINGRRYSQRWIQNLSETLKHPKPVMSFFRGGFKEYDDVTKIKPKHFGKKLYLATGNRVYSQWGGKYDAYLQEDKSDFRKGVKCIPFYKTASPQIFHPPLPNIVYNLDYDLCWPCNFTQIRQKGQEFFIKTIGQSKYLKSLGIVHCGNRPEVGKKLCKKYGVNNISFLGSLHRTELNNVLNHSWFGVCMSNRVDGCPRIATEILMSRTPLIVRDKTRLLPYYKNRGVVEVTDQNIEGQIKQAFRARTKLRSDVALAVKDELSFEKICQKNIELWQKI
jgi:hypothetical protein